MPSRCPQTRPSRARIALFVAVVVAAGCLRPPDETLIGTSLTNPDVDAGALVADVAIDVLTKPKPDAKLFDVGPVHNPVDTGPFDAGPKDTGPKDTGPKDTGPKDTGPKDVGPKPVSKTVAWGYCTSPPWTTNVPKKGLALHCGALTVPLSYNDGDPQTLDLAIHRVRQSTAPTPLGHLIVLQGGPGGSGSGLRWLAPYIFSRLPNWQLYFPDHRGVGGSYRLDCPSAEKSGTPGGVGIHESEFPACQKWTQQKHSKVLPHIRTTHAARDIKALVDALREADGPVKRPIIIYGVSYGTYWLHRLIDLYPDIADGYVMDGMCSPGSCDISSYSKRFDKEAKKYFAACGKNTVCAKELTKDPVGLLKALHGKVEKGHCAGVLGKIKDKRNYLRVWLAYFSVSASLRPFALALARRLDRCNAADVAALKHLFKTLNKGLTQPKPQPERSSVVTAHISLSELWATPEPTAKHIQAEHNATLIAPKTSVWLLPVKDTWPRYKEPLAKQWAQTGKPVLVLHGDHDPQTPIDEAYLAKDKLKAPVQLVVMTGVLHGALVGSVSPTNQPCGIKLLADFANKPGPVNASCSTKLKPVTFAANAQWVKMLLNSPSLFGVSKGAKAPPPPPLDPAQHEASKRALEEELRRIGRILPAP